MLPAEYYDGSKLIKKNRFKPFPGRLEKSISNHRFIWLETFCRCQEAIVADTLWQINVI